MYWQREVELYPQRWGWWCGKLGVDVVLGAGGCGEEGVVETGVTPLLRN